MLYRKNILAGGVCILALSMAQASYGQQAPITIQSDAEAAALAQAEADAEVDALVVTGSNIRGVKPVGSELVTVTREDITNTGLASLNDIAQTVSQIQAPGAAVREGGNTAINSTQGTALNLRGLGAGGTLLLVDGRRIAPTGTNTSFTEANQVPPGALERIEIVPDGASAVYGADAVGGVVNYVLRKSLDGLELTGRYQGGHFNHEYNGTLLAGKTWEGIGPLGAGNILVSVAQSDRTPMFNGESRYLRQDKRPLGGADGRYSGQTITLVDGPGVVVVPRTVASGNNPVYSQAALFDYLTLPTTSSGTGLTAGSFTRNDPNLAILDTSDYSVYYSDLSRTQATAFINQELTENISFFFEGFYSIRKTVSQSLPTATVTVPTSSPYYIPGIVAGPLTVRMNLLKDVGLTDFHNQSETYTLTSGLKYELPLGWSGETYLTYGDDRTCGICTTTVNGTALNYQIAQGNLAINPFNSAPNSISAAALSTFMGGRVQTAHNYMTDFVTKASGRLFDLPGGTARAALGYEYTKTSIGFYGATNSGTLNAFVNNVPRSTLSRIANSGFAEVYVPIIGPNNKLPFVEEFIVNAAVRYDHYSDFDATTNPKFGFGWKLTDELSARGSWGTAYKAPGLPEKNPKITSLVSAANVVNRAGDPNIPVTNTANGTSSVVLLQGANADLRAETATVWGGGLDYKPKWLPGFSGSLTYYNIDYADQLVYFASGVMLIDAQARQDYAEFITPTPQPVGCVHGNYATYNPLLVEALTGPNLTGTPPTNDCAVTAVLDTRANNAASTRQDGLDISGNYRLPTTYGDFSFSGSYTYILSSKSQITPSTREFDSLGLINTATSNYPLEWKGRLGVDWSKGPFSAGLSQNYIGSYFNNLPATINGVVRPKAEVPSWITYDMRFGYRFGETDPLRLSLTLVNVFDRDPPITFTAAGCCSGAAFDGVYHNPLGRRVTLSFTKEF